MMSVDTQTVEVEEVTEIPETAAQTIGNTRRFARIAHGALTDKLGNPYITHLDAVAHNVYLLVGFDVDLIKAALLHDTLEDTAVSRIRLEMEGFSPRTIHAVEAVTKAKGEANYNYTTRVIEGGTAPMIVKLADLYHNAAPKRLAQLSPAVQDRLKEKYLSAIWRIEHALIKEGVLTDDDRTVTFEEALDAVKSAAVTTTVSAWEWKKRHPTTLAAGDRVRFAADPTIVYTVVSKRTKQNGKYAFEMEVDGKPFGMDVVLDYNTDKYETMWRPLNTYNTTAKASETAAKTTTTPVATTAYIPTWKKRLGLPGEWSEGDTLPDTLEGEK